jgi:hypothetical protein
MIDAAFLGSLVGDAEMKTSKNGKPYLRFRVAVGGGDEVQYVGVMLFGDCVDELRDARAPPFSKASRPRVPSLPCHRMSERPSPLKSPVPLICQLGPGLNEPAIPVPAAPVAANASNIEQGGSSTI